LKFQREVAAVIIFALGDSVHISVKSTEGCQ